MSSGRGQRSQTSPAASGSCFSAFCASHDNENDAGGRYCHNLRWYDDRIALSFSVAIEFSIRTDAGVAPLGLWMRPIEAEVKIWSPASHGRVMLLCHTRLLRVLYGAQGPQLVCTQKTLTPPQKITCLCTVAKGILLV